MEISLNTTYYEISNIQKNTLKVNKELKSDKNISTDTDIVNRNMIQEQTDTEQLQNNIKNFVNLCKQFPDIAFVVVDFADGPLPEYNGICNTAAFGDLDKISICIDEKVIEKFEEDFDNITRKIQCISDNYGYYKSNAEMSNCNYTGTTLYYEGAKLGVTQTLWPGNEPPKFYRETGFLEPSSRDDTDNDTKEKYFQTLLLNMQYDSYNKPFEIGEDDDERENEKKYKTESGQKYVEKYQKNFLYT